MVYGENLKSRVLIGNVFLTMSYNMNILMLLRKNIMSYRVMTESEKKLLLNW